MSDSLLDHAERATDLIAVADTRLDDWLEQQGEPVRRWLSTTGFRAKSGSVCWLPDTDGQPARVVVGFKEDDPWSLGGLSRQLPDGVYRLCNVTDPAMLSAMTLNWGLGAYRFTRYREADRAAARLLVDPAVDGTMIRRQVRAVALVRDLVNTPAADLLPEQLAEAAAALASEFGAGFSQIVGEELLTANYPMIHAVGRASASAPRLLDLRWGDPAAPRLTLVGKGVCFDSGGLDLKPASGMRLMKKDMGGAAHALGLARLVMDAGLPVRLRVLIPAVENAVSGNAFRPGDILATRKGITVEVDNTDAEGRLVLADALTEACSETPDLLLDFATLTGAARVALGPDLPAFFSNDDGLAGAVLESATAVRDPLWRMPLFRPYRDYLNSKVANIVNSASTPFGGAITAALFLQEFVAEGQSWAHLDLMAWNTKDRPGRPEGGEAVGIRALFHYLHGRFAKKSA